jgi:Ser/Thr protein kinase RdoA (MazF antagonist)
MTGKERMEMQRREIAEICQRQVLDKASALFRTQKDALKVFPDYEGAANLVYEYEMDGEPMVLRLSYTRERSEEQIRAELHFVNYLAEHGVRVSRPTASTDGNLVETVLAEGIPFRIVSFVKGKGMRLPDNGYRYRADVPIEEYFQNWGQVLGKMHALTKHYRPLESARRPEWFVLNQTRFAVETQVPEHLQVVRTRIQSTLDKLKSLPRDQDSFGLIHGDFNDGNFTVDYSSGDITVFDFDDSCYFWFMYELACAWDGGLGWAAGRGLGERRAFMDRYMDQVLQGYNRENTVSAEWLARLPLFIRLIQIEEFLHYVQYIDEPDEELQAELGYAIKCIEREIPYKGFFDSIYSSERPFSL